MALGDRALSTWRSRSRRWAWPRREALVGLAFLLPSLILLGIFVFYPLGYVVYLSLLKWDLITPASVVGLSNYAALFKDSYFLQAVQVTVAVSAASVGITLPLGFLCAVFLNLKLRESAFYRGILLAPYIFPLVASGIAWSMMFQQDGGILNWLIRHLGGSGLNWLGSSTWAVVAVIIVGVWQYLGYYTLIFLAGLQGIPPDYYEAAAIDGAGNVVQAVRITLPLLSPTLLFATIILIIQSFQTFSQVYVMTQGGPAGATTTLVYYLYEVAFQFFQIGKAGAISVLLLLFLVGITLIQLILARRWVHYEL
jgi:multiple sugar transport system permease protein/sn-glycerol 3-phosphate transport system permease protein